MAQNCSMGIVAHSVPHPTIPNRIDRYYTMDRDTFTLLAIGFTGNEALTWKIKYISAFNAMETKLKLQNEPPPRQIEAEAASPEFQKYASDRLYKIYREGSFDPDHLLDLLFQGQIPYTPDNKYRLYLEETCQALGISPSDPAFDFLPPPKSPKSLSIPRRAKWSARPSPNLGSTSSTSALAPTS